MKEINTYTAMDTSGILLNANESYKNINQKVLNEIAEAIKTLPFNRYPEDDYTTLCESYGKYAGRSKEEIICGNGSDALLGLIIGLYIKEGKTLFTLSKDFGMYDYYCSMQGGNVAKYEWKMDAPFDVDDFIKAAKTNHADLIIFSNPNNPTGRLISCDDICKILEAFTDTMVVIDEAYIDFCKGSMIDYIDDYKNLIITRTLSKAFALAGIRLGFMICNKETMDVIRPYKVPYNVNRLSEISAIIALQYMDEVKDSIQEICLERDALYEKVKALDVDNFVLYPSSANYLYGISSRKEEFFALLKKENITIRDYRGTDTFRITIGSKEQNEIIYNCIKSM